MINIYYSCDNIFFIAVENIFYSFDKLTEQASKCVWTGTCRCLEYLCSDAWGMVARRNCNKQL